jgi:hypothetical protein
MLSAELAGGTGGGRPVTTGERKERKTQCSRSISA